MTFYFPPHWPRRLSYCSSPTSERPCAALSESSLPLKTDKRRTSHGLALTPTGASGTRWVSVTAPSDASVGQSYTLALWLNYLTAVFPSRWRPATAALRRLLRVDVHVLRVSQQADPLLLLPLLRHLSERKGRKEGRRVHLSSAPQSSSSSSSSSLKLCGLWCRSLSKKRSAACDGGSWIPDTKTETWLQEISEIKQSAWVITQVRASVTAAIKVTFLAKNLTLGEAGAAARASALKRNNINSETNKVLQWVFQQK